MGEVGSSSMVARDFSTVFESFAENFGPLKAFFAANVFESMVA